MGIKNKMNLIIKLAFRNLVRQKRRNSLLGLAMAFGMMILVIANSFSHGISDTLINRIIVLMTGHIDVSMVEKGNVRAPFMRERERFEAIIRENVTDIKHIKENLGLLARVVGNGKSDNCWLDGISKKDFEGLKDQFQTLHGDLTHIFNTEMVNPCILSKTKAEFLNIKLHDPLRIRLQNIHGQQQTGILTVAAIVKSSNMFTDFASFLSVENIKKLRGLREYETGSLQIILEKPQTAIEQANRLHSVLKPGFAWIPGTVSVSELTLINQGEKKVTEVPIAAIGFYRDKSSQAILTKWIRLQETQRKRSFSAQGVMITEALKNKLKIETDDYINLKYRNRYDEGFTERDFKVTGIMTYPSNDFPENLMLLSDKLFYKAYYNHLPQIDSSMEKTLTDSLPDSIRPALSSEWNLLERSRDFNEMKKKFKDFMSKKKSAAALDIRTMHETASNIIKLEYVLNLITLFAVIILFFIILIGVVNTLRMTIKERTREIGTIRAIGMKRKDVRNLIVAESFMLAFFSTIIGTIAALLVMKISQLWEIHADSFMNILLVDHKLYFLPNMLSISLNMLLILFISVITAYFPSRKAANKMVADALRHVE